MALLLANTPVATRFAVGTPVTGSVRPSVGELGICFSSCSPVLNAYVWTLYILFLLIDNSLFHGLDF
jgi:hypothetical protein